ncbi:MULTISPECIES: hypothetical protein [unclassified Coleofasciculus]|uniref:hypothetical protein n=1 Tax=unclassified Coleofasciculus TaxID=2692782 RepID=UPI0018819E01|nr:MULTISPECIES: hypothetical protein [unclassified Coleofasciculus]MBE9126342.1 hypothetical protein [Coleofasciculus sp. LEGE 07081]MBE9147481.1 hypothetical protein [Coleofasciculus sp. LEGE 07092]
MFVAIITSVEGNSVVLQDDATEVNSVKKNKLKTIFVNKLSRKTFRVDDLVQMTREIGQ